MDSVKLGFDHRFGHLHIQTEGAGQWSVAISDLIRQLAIRPEEWAGHQAIADKPAETRDLETICRDAIKGLKLKGKTVLDIGGYDGRMAAYALECGAKRAICLDNEQWEHYGWTEKDRLPGVEYVVGDFLEWTEPVDVVICYNVVYHVKNLYQFFEHLRSMTKKTMLLCSLVRFDDQSRWYQYNPYECNLDDDTVYFGPSSSALIKMLELTGFKTTELGQAVERLVLKCW